MSAREQTGKSTADQAASNASPEKKRHHWGRLLSGTLLVVGILVLLAPQIVSRLATQPAVLQAVAPGLPKNLRIGRASLGWQSPVLLRDVSLEAADGSDLMTIDSVTSRESLWDLVSNVRLPLTLDVGGIQAAYVVRPPTSREPLDLDLILNQLTNALRQLATSDVPQPARDTTVRLRDGSITLRDQTGQTLMRLAPLSGTCVLKAGTGGHRAQPRQSYLSLQLPVAEPQTEGVGEVQLEWNFLPDSSGVNSATAVVTVQRLPADPLQPLVQQGLGGGEVQGAIDGVLRAEVSRGAEGRIGLEGELSLGSFDDPPQPVVVLNGRPHPADGATLPFALTTLQSRLDLSYDLLDDRFRIEPISITSDLFEVSLHGAIDELSGRADCEISGTVRCEFPAWAALIPEHLREQVNVEGLEVEHVSFRGPLRPDQQAGMPPGDEELMPQSPQPVPPAWDGMVAETTVRWDRWHAFGLTSDQGAVQLHLEQGLLEAIPQDVQVNGGRLRALPQMDLGRDRLRLLLPSGVVLDEVEITESMCRSWLQYISPIVANTTSLSGSVSLSTEAGEVHIDDLRRSEVTGELHVREWQLGLGPIVRPILVPVQQWERLLGRGGRDALSRAANESWKVSLSEQRVRFHLRDERVHHRELVFRAGDVVLATSGSVGLDESLDLIVSLHLPDRWFSNRGAVLESLRGERIEVVVRGTLDDPQIDVAPLAEFGKRIGTKAAGGLLLELLNRGRPSQRDEK